MDYIKIYYLEYFLNFFLEEGAYLSPIANESFAEHIQSAIKVSSENDGRGIVEPLCKAYHTDYGCEDCKKIMALPAPNPEHRRR